MWIGFKFIDDHAFHHFQRYDLYISSNRYLRCCIVDMDMIYIAEFGALVWSGLEMQL